MGNEETIYKTAPQLPKWLFWDIKDRIPDYDQHPEWVITRVFEYGSMENIADIINYYGIVKVKHVLTHVPHLPEDIMYLEMDLFSRTQNYTKLAYNYGRRSNQKKSSEV